MKVGNYVRTKHWGIFKVLKIIYENGKTKVLKEKGHTVTIYDDEVIIEDSKVINLIEVGDYVNGMKVTFIDKDVDGDKYVFGYSKDGFDGETWFYNNEIKSIVTKEQFEFMEYKVGE